MPPNLGRSSNENFSGIQKCSRSFPRVNLARMAHLSTKREVDHVQNLEIFDMFPNQLFLGWISTLTVVLLLGSWLLEPNGRTYDIIDVRKPVLFFHCDSSDMDEDNDDNDGAHDDTLCKDEYRFKDQVASIPKLDILISSEDGSRKLDDPSTTPLNTAKLRVGKRNIQSFQTASFQLHPPPKLKHQRHAIIRKNTANVCPFRCFSCSRNFKSFHTLLQHRRAFTHILMKKLKRLRKSRAQTNLKRRKPQHDSLSSQHHYKDDLNVGVLRPLKSRQRNIVRTNIKRENSSEDEISKSENNDEDWDCSNFTGDSSDTSSSSSCSDDDDVDFKLISDCSESETRVKIEVTPAPAPTANTSNVDITMKRHACNIDSCTECFSVKEELEIHKKFHGSFPCALCDTVEDYAPNLVLHESEHMKKKKTETNPEENAGTSRKKMKKVTRYCARCNYSTGDKRRFINHYLVTHLNLPTQMRCSICKGLSVSSDKETLLIHMKECHETRSHPVKKEKNHHCDRTSCNMSFTTESKLIAHQRLHGSFSCKNNNCSFVADFGPALALHELTHKQPKIDKNERHICPRCNVQTRSRNSYVSHFLWIHLRLRPGVGLCSICKVPLMSAGRAHHFFSHHDKRRAIRKVVSKCKLCPAYFLRQEQLLKHLKMMHDTCQEVLSSDEEELIEGPSHPIKCVTCGKCFEHQNSLQKHHKICLLKPIKLEKKTFACEQGTCQKRFKYEEELEIHKKHHGKFTCQFCDVVKTYLPNLALHERVHAKTEVTQDKKIFHCVRCGFEKNYKDAYINHYLEKHFKLPIQLVMCPICKVMLPQRSYPGHRKTFLHDKKEGDTKCKLVRKYKKRAARSPSKKAVSKTQRSKRMYCGAPPDCRKSFESGSDLENHRKLHGKFTCSICSMEETYAPNLALHEATHLSDSFVENSRPAEQSYKCSRCPFTISSKRPVYINHFLEKHLNLPSESVTCQNCGDKFSFYNGDLRKHMRKKHDTKAMGENDIARCDQCPAFFSQQKWLFHHKRKVHFVEDTTTCCDCGKKFSHPAALRSHRIKKHKKKEADFLFRCDAPGCERRFERELDLGWHKLNVHENKSRDLYNPSVCHECGKVCPTQPSFSWHMRRFHASITAPPTKKERKRYVCEECGKVFQAQVILDYHKLYHSGPASWKYGCIFCEKKCATKDKLIDHIRIHTKEKPYSCEYCGEEYAHGHNLRNHKNSKHNANDVPRKRTWVNGYVSKKGQKLPPRSNLIK
ncbi:unnamed protein product [Orchesella dallaii]|uniref:C2H2-type domain-containing protein n=1 Tax=Orchesella dallaii TaxID=48710 RepID=A0ABP1RLE4_9HEXA